MRVQTVEHLRTHLLADRLVELTLHVGAHFVAQAVEIAVRDAEAPGEFFIERRRHLFLDFPIFTRNGGLAGELFLWMIGAESRIGLTRIAGGGAEQRVFEFLHDLAGADGDRDMVTAAAVELHAVDPCR